jgi:hypothetical protein
MTEGTPTTQDSGINWAAVIAGGLLLAVAVVGINDVFLRAVAAVAIFSLTFYLARSREEPTVEQPLLDKLRGQKGGLDRRKYGRLRGQTDRLLDQVRQMNRVAVEGREGKLAPSHSHAELDRLATMMHDYIDEIRKSAGVPTPMYEGEARSGKVVKPHIVLPKAVRDESEPAETGTVAEPVEESDETDKMLDDLVARARGGQVTGVDDDRDSATAGEDLEESGEGESEPGRDV